MKTFRMAIVAMGLAALVASQASAQGQGRGFGFGGMGGGAMLLTNKSVLKELKADDKQTEALATAAQEIMAKQREAMQGFQDLSQEERREKMQEVQKSVMTDVNKALKDTLKEEQVKRFHQLRLQTMGARALMDADAAKELKITDEQKTKLQELLQDQMAQSREIFMNAGDDREGAMKKMQELNKETKEKAIALLSADQKKSWEGLVGASFEYVPEMPRRPGN